MQNMTDTAQISKPVELSSIINVVQHDGPKPGKLELKSVVCLGPNVSKKSKEPGVKRHDLKSSSKVSKVYLEKPVLLLPFGHQVSGRASILCYDETTLLKPYVSRELFFYQTLPQDLKKFTPQFRGLVTVSFIEDSRTASVLAYALPRTLVKPNTKNIIKLFDDEPKPHSKRCVKDYGKTHVIFPSITQKTTGNRNDENLFVDSFENVSPVISEIKKDSDVVSELSEGFDVTVCIEDKKVSSGKENEENSRVSTTGLHNPWNSKVLDDAWLKLKISNTDNPSNGKKKRFTLLENAVARYRRPCVLDLKIGTRVRHDASPEKIARHVTAINLGARLSGMQVYHPDQEKFTYYNKYYGHNLTVSGFKSNLKHFFSRGGIPIQSSKSPTKRKNLSSVDKNLVQQAVKKLIELKNTIESIKSHRFYSSSVLLLYEGDLSRQWEGERGGCSEDNVVITDKSHCQKERRKNNEKSSQMDCKETKKRNSHKTSEKLEQSHKHKLRNSDSAKHHKEKTKCHFHEKHSHKHHGDMDRIHSENDSKFTAHEDLKRKHSDVLSNSTDIIEVKMIDFAHYCFHDDEMHPGPDGGFIFGLNCLIGLLNEMLMSPS
ncbi:inositol hexakisphosphate kinase 3-like [Styela clava]